MKAAEYDYEKECTLMTSKFVVPMIALALVGSCSALSDDARIIKAEPYKSIPPNKSLSLTHMIGADALTIRSEPKFAGAISSLTYRGQEYVNSTDHGRLMQGAIAYDGHDKSES